MIHPRHTQKILGHKNMNSSAVYMDVCDREVAESYVKIAKQREEILISTPV
jgi:hypothetical protein